MKPRLLSCIEQWPNCSEGDYNPKCCRFPKSCSCTVYDPAYVPADLLEAPPVSVPNPCRSCGVSLQHCLEMRDDTGTYCCRACANRVSLHAGSSPESEAERRAQHLTPGAHRTLNNQRTTADLRPGDTVRGAGPTVRTVLENIPPRPGSRWHVLRWQDGTSFWSESDDTWELPEPNTLQADAWDQGYAAGRADTAAEQRNVSRPPHLYARNPYRA